MCILCNVAMKIEEVLNRAVVIDNIEEEGEAIVDALQKVDVPVDFIRIGSSEGEISAFKHPRESIFADLLLDDNISNLVPNISRLIDIIQRIQPECTKYYGIVLWTKHKEYSGQFLKRIGNATARNAGANQESSDEEEIDTSVMLNSAPLFVLCMDKTSYQVEGSWNFDRLLDDINTELQKSRIAYFSLAWRKLVNDSVENVLNDIYGLSSNFENHEECLSYILRELSRNETGEKEDTNLTSGVYQVFDSLLNSELLSIVKNESLPDLSGITENPFGGDVKTLHRLSAKLNSCFFIESNNLNTREILPGNIYRILDSNSPLILHKNQVEDVPVDVGDGIFKFENTYSRVNIAIELTPPCDHAYKKIYSRFVGGYIFDIPIGEYTTGSKAKVYKFNKSDKCYPIYPIFVPGDKNVKCIVFDFRCLWTLTDTEIKNEDKYKLWFKAKPGLFADVLQKFSSHASRLGLNDIHLERIK